MPKKKIFESVKKVNKNENQIQNKQIQDIKRIIKKPIIKDKKVLKISTISKAFDIDKEKAMEWIKILESGDLCIIEYPTFGEPFIKIKEKELPKIKHSVENTIKNKGKSPEENQEKSPEENKEKDQKENKKKFKLKTKIKF